MTKGFLIIAHKNPEYGKFAAVLAASIRKWSDLPICIAHDLEARLSRPAAHAHGVQTVGIQTEHNHPFYLKALLNKYTPFDQTIYLDADSFCTKNPDHLFTGTDFDAFVMKKWPGNQCNSIWADLKGLRRHYGFSGVYPELNSSFMHWTKGPKSDAIFMLAEALYAEHWYRNWNAKMFITYPDELAFNLALAILEHPMEKGGPLFMRYRKSGMPTEEQMEPYPFFSLPGIAQTHGHLWRIYRNSIRALNRDEKLSLPIPEKHNKYGKRATYRGIREVSTDLEEVITKAKEFYASRATIKV